MGSHGASDLHLPYVLDGSGEISIVSAAKGGGHGPPGGGSGGGGTGGTGSPTSTLGGTSTGLEINLIWDTSVQSASNWSDIESTVVSAAQLFTSEFTNHAVLNIDVGYGEVAGQNLLNGALGESQTQGYVLSYSQITNALATADAGLVASGQMAAGAVTAVTALAATSIYVTAAE